jgi:hypothetical protein
MTTMKLKQKPRLLKAFKESCIQLQQDDIDRFVFALSDHLEGFVNCLPEAKLRYERLLEYKPYLKGNPVIVENLKRLEAENK